MARVLIVGAGAAGLFAAGRAMRAGHSVTIIEHMDAPGQKLLITGKGRCNLTNNCDETEFLRGVRHNPRFLYSAVSALPPADVMDLFEKELGVPLKTERGRRVFPVSDRAEDVLDALMRWSEGARMVRGEASELLMAGVRGEGELGSEIEGKVKGEGELGSEIEPELGLEGEVKGKGESKGEALRVAGVKLASGQRLEADAVIVATGGLSYPVTGSTGGGYKLARQAGHSIVTPLPSLVSMVEQGKVAKSLMGLSLRNVGLTLYAGEKAVFCEQGEMVFTHFGISGPLVLSASVYLGDMNKHSYKVCIDLKPALSLEVLDARLQRDFLAFSNREAANCLDKLLPASMRSVMLDVWGVEPQRRVNQITREERGRLAALVKAFPIKIGGRGDLAHAVITAGGVDVKEVSPKTMESKLLPGLYFAGEVLDVDGYTGGYNLQIAWSTASAAGLGI